MKRITESWQAIRVVILISDPDSYKDVLITSAMSIQATDSYFLYRDRMTFTIHLVAVKASSPITKAVYQ